jgi:hypothetical protein
MTTRIMLWGTHGRITVDRQECQVYLRDTATVPEGYQHGWNVRYTTDLTPPVWFFVRGEEYIAELDHYVSRVAASGVQGPPLNSFASASVTDKAIEMMIVDATTPRTVQQAPARAEARHRLQELRSRLVERWRRRRGRIA